MTEGQKRIRLSSAKMIPLSFLSAIVLGTVFLLLPMATAPGETTNFTTAFFTSTTSFCVTGLVVVDTYAHWTLFGKVIILIMIQLGGLGIITTVSALMYKLQKKMSFSQTLMIHDSFSQDSMSGLIRFLRGVVRGTFFVEGVGACLYMISFIPEFGTGKGIWISCFTAISAFCNAGIDIIGPNSLINYQSDTLVMITTMMLIILGGLGYVVWFDLFRGAKEGFRKKWGPIRILKRVSEHSKLVLSLTLFLILSGALCVYILERDNPETLGGMSLGDKILNSLFQSVTFRTAGFAAVPQGALRESTCFLGLLFMFIGGSPVGTAGGVKTVTMFVLMLDAVAFIRNRNEKVVFRYSVSNELIRKASAIVVVSISVTFILTILLMASCHTGMVNGTYEMFSATATVGLSRGLTPLLNTAGRWIVILAMYLGRIGPISMALFFTGGVSSEKNKVHFTDGRYYVG